MDYRRFQDGDMTVDEFMARVEAAMDSQKPTIDLVQAEIGRESDRGLALIGAAFVDEALDSLLEAHFEFSVGHAGFPDGGNHRTILRELASPVGGPLGTFSNKAKMAYMLNLIKPDTFSDSLTIAKIRNKFAHVLKISSFEDNSVVDLTRNLREAQDYDVTGLDKRDQARNRFAHTVGSVGIVLLGKTVLSKQGFPVHMLPS